MQHIPLSEQVVIKCLLQNNDLIYNIESNYFITPIGSNIYESIKNLISKGIETTENHIILESKNQDINTDLLKSLDKIEYNIDNFENYLSDLRINYVYDKNFDVANQISIEQNKKSNKDLNKLKNLYTTGISNLDLITGKKQLLLDSETLMTRYQHTLHKRLSGGSFFSTGDNYLDSILATGFSPQKITTIFAPSGIGKSSFALNLVNKQINKNIPCCYVTLENDVTMTMDRLISKRLKIPVKQFYPNKQGEIEDHIFKLVEVERQKLLKCKNFRMVEESSLSLNDIETLVEECKRAMGVDYIVMTIDLLTMLSDFSGEDAKMYEAGLNKLHQIARKTNCHFVCVVQANADADSYIPKKFEDIYKLKPGINQTKNSRVFRERSRILIGLVRPKYYAEIYFPDAPELDLMDDVVNCYVLKQNEGNTGMIKYLFKPEYYDFVKFVEE